MLDQIKMRWRALFRKDKLEQELDDELRFHLERDAEHNAHSGMNLNDQCRALDEIVGKHDLAISSLGGCC